MMRIIGLYKMIPPLGGLHVEVIDPGFVMLDDNEKNRRRPGDRRCVVGRVLASVRFDGASGHQPACIEECLSATTTDDPPWYVVPTDDKENARLIISQIVVDILEVLGMHYPKTTVERARELQSIRDGLVA